ncbi:hypothetical protein C3L33_03692, partial [Rhododendron williamsianum]
MGWIGEAVDSVKSLRIRQVLSQAVSLGSLHHFPFPLTPPHRFHTHRPRDSGALLVSFDRHLPTIPRACFQSLQPYSWNYICMIVTSALIIWKGLMCVTGSESPVVVVLSGSMEPGFKRGDILFLHMSKDPIRAGEIVVFNVDGREIPIVHRVIKVHERQDTEDVDVLTKGTAVVCPILDFFIICLTAPGDNNMGDDRPLYAHGQLWLQRHHIMGRAVGFLPYVGWVTIIMTEKPIIKYLLIGALGLLVITSKE